MTQVWKLGDKLFSTYGVFVQSSSGLLDIPAMTDEGHDWLDDDGKSYWLDASELKNADRDIILNCWITASTYEAFKTNVASFFAAITAEGLDTLTTPLGTIANVSLHESVPVTRTSTYVMSRSAGAFTLRLKVLGESTIDTALTVYTPYPYYELPIATIPSGSDIKVVKRMHGEAYVTCQVESDNISAIYRYDYVKIYSASPTVCEKYYLDKDPEVHKLSSNKYVINYRFEQETYLLRHIMFLSESGESDFYWFANFDEILDRLMINATRYQIGLFAKDDAIPSTIRKTHKFSAQSCWDVLVSLCEEYELEFEWRYNGTDAWTLYVSERIERTWPYTLEYGRGEGFYEITREALSNEELCTVLYAYGANKNLKYDYGYERLVCPGNPLTNNDTVYGRIEQVKFFDDIFPALSASADAYTQVLAVTGDPAYEAIKEVWPTGMFRMTASVGFNLAETDASGYSTYLLGIPAKVAMRDGDLAGMEFEINKYDPVDSDVPTGPGYFFLDPIVDEHAGTFPSEDFYIKAGDEFTLLDINQPSSYISDAESTLLATATAWLADHSVPKVTYRAVLDPAIVRVITLAGYGVNIGDAIEVIDAELSMNGTYRISELTMDYESKRYDLTLSERRPLTPREKLIQSVRKLEKTVDATKATTEVGTQKSDETTAEVINRILDRRDGRIKPERIRTESADPRTLAYDAGVPQFQVIGMIVETSYQDDPNKVKVGAGSIEVLNWAPLTRTRYDISKMIAEGETYDPRRVWTFPETIITLPDNDPYYLLAKLPRDPLVTAGELVATDTWIRVKADADYLQYNLGMINSPGSPRVASMLWGNVRPSAADITSSIDPRLLGGGRVLYLHGNESDLTGYGQALYTEPDDPNFTYTASGADTRVMFYQFVSATGMGTIPAGAWVFTTYGAVTTDDQVILGVEVYRLDATGGELPVMDFTQDLDDVIVAPFYHAEPLDQLVMSDDERLAFRYYADFGSAIPHTAYLMVEGDAEGYYWWSNIRIPGDGNDVASGGLATVETDMSVTGDGSAGTPVKLVNDEATPGNSKYYGTNASGAKGYHALPSAEDNYVDDATFDKVSRDLTLTRTGILDDLVVNIPCCNPLDMIEGVVTNVKYGYLYNWWAATDARNIAPAGWHVPTNAEFITLRTYLGGIDIAGGKLKETGYTYWVSPNTGATNEVEFNARGSGYRSSSGFNNSLGTQCNFWIYDLSGAYILGNGNAQLSLSGYSSYWGNTIRLIKDNSTDTGTMVGNDGKVYPTVTIGTQVWMAANLMETKYRDGDLISGPTFTNAAWAALTTEAYCIYGDDPTNAGNEDEVLLQHNLLGGLQGGSTTERYHMTNAQHSWMEVGAAISATGSFTTADGKTVTYSNGIITSVI